MYPETIKMFEEFIQVELWAWSRDAQEVYNMYFLEFVLQSDWNLYSLNSAWETPGKSYCFLSTLRVNLFAFFMLSVYNRFPNCVFTAINHNIVLTPFCFDPVRLLSISRFCATSWFIFSLFLHWNSKTKKLAICD